MKVTIGEKGRSMSHQRNFPKITKCCRCKAESRIAFVAHECIPKNEKTPLVVSLHANKGKGNYWVHDACAVAVYFCRDCLEPTALYNQA